MAKQNKKVLNKIKKLLDKDTQKVLVFNKESGEYCGMVVTGDPSELDTTFFKHKIVKFDPDIEMWDGGDWSTGKIIPINESKPVILERDINSKTESTIIDRYPWYRQINILIKAVESIIEDSGVSNKDVDEFNKMVEYLKVRRDLNSKYKNAYTNDSSFIYITEQEESDKSNRRIAGGLHEVSGPKDISNIGR